MANDNNNNTVNSILSHLASAASVAADGVTGAFHSASNVVGDKYDQFRLSMDLSRLKEEQSKIFEDIGQTMYMIKTGVFIEQKTTDSSDAETENKTTDTQETIDNLLLLADQKQQEIDLLSERMNAYNDKKTCPSCGKVASDKDAFCSACGTKL